MDYQRDRHSVHLIVYHLIWCPKWRRRVLVGAVQKRLEQIINEFAHLRNLPTLWSPSYFLSTAGNVSSETIQRYIQQQSEN